MNFFLRQIFLSFQQNKNEVLSLNIDKVRHVDVVLQGTFVGHQISEIQNKKISEKIF